MLLSVVAPIYFAQNSVEVLVKLIVSECSLLQMDFEIILIEDGSTDNTWEKIEVLSSDIPQLRGIKLSRNFGQHYAIACGIEQAKGDWIIVMDGDLQDHPSAIKQLLAKANEGYDIVVAKRISRQTSFLNKIYSIIFWKILSYLTGRPLHHSISNFGIYHRRVIDAIISMRDAIRFFPTMVDWVGFKKTTIDMPQQARHEGKSTYSFNKMIRLALDVVLVNSEKPLRLVTKTGIFISIISFVVGVIYLYKHLTHQIEVPGYASIIISIWFLGGLIICILGILGLYIGKTFDAVKNRPYYIIEKTTR